MNKFKKFFVVFILLIFFTLFNLYSKSRMIGKKAKDFRLKSINGKVVRLSKVLKKNKLVLINFWATWCPPCRAEIPGLAKVYKKYKNKGFIILGISLDRNVSPSMLKDFKYQFKKYLDVDISYPILIGSDKVVRNFGGIRAIPTSFLIDKKGIIREHIIGYISDTYLESLIKKYLFKKQKRKK